MTFYLMMGLLIIVMPIGLLWEYLDERRIKANIERMKQERLEAYRKSQQK